MNDNILYSEFFEFNLRVKKITYFINIITLFPSSRFKIYEV